MLLHSRLRPLPRRQNQPQPECPSSAPPPDFQEDEIDDESPEDMFTSFLPHLFPDDVPSFHGDPGQQLLYSSPRYGNLQIMVPSYPNQSEKRTEEIAAGQARPGGHVNQVEEGRKLFAHFLWSAAMVVAEGVEKADALDSAGQLDPDTEMCLAKGHSVLELGAGEY